MKTRRSKNALGQGFRVVNHAEVARRCDSPQQVAVRRARSLAVFWLVSLLLAAGSPVGAQQVNDPRRVALDEFQRVPPFVVRVDVDRPDRMYRAGNAIQVSVRSERAGYLYLFYCDANRQVTCLFPNKIQQDNRIAADQTLIIPSQESRFRLRVGPPFGREILKAVVTTQPLEILEIKALTKGEFTSIDPQKFKGVFVELREEAVPSDAPTATPTAPATPTASRGWSEHALELTTVAADAESPTRPSLAEIAREGNGLGAVGDLVVAGHTPSGNVPDAGPSALRVGVFIGISKYRDQQIRPLASADEDARAMAQVLLDRGQLSESVVLIDEQATLANIQRLLQTGLPAVTKPGDLIILYWSGHGGRAANVDGNEPDGFDEYLVPYDGSLESSDAIRRTMLLDKDFGRLVQHLDGRQLVIILDACHSGGQTPGARKALTGNSYKTPFRDFFFHPALKRIKDIGQRETAVLASSRATQLSFEQRGGNASVMTHFLLERLKSGDDPVTLREAANYVLPRVPAFVKEHYPGATQVPVFVDQTTPPVYLRP